MRSATDPYVQKSGSLRRIAEIIHKQAHGIGFGKVAANGRRVLVELLFFVCLVEVAQKRLQLSNNVAIETQISARELVGQNGSPGEQPQRRALHIGWRGDQDI